MSILKDQSKNWAKANQTAKLSQKASDNSETQSNTSITHCPKCGAKFKEVGISIGTSELIPHTANFCVNCRLASPR